jgi:NADPH2:quinone reductase
MGKTVAMIGGAMYAQYRSMKADQCLLLPDGTTAAEGASCFVNPLTALGMVETMRRDGHSALIHTAAASNLGQMLNRICIKDGIQLVNIVRKPEQAELLKGIGAQYVCDTSAPTFMDDLTEALVATGATVAFDATGGGKLAGQILSCMEAALGRTATEYSRYGTNVHKQVYIYGGLNTGPTEITRNFGFAWGVGGWLLFPFLQTIGAEANQRLRQRVAAELKTTFASHYSKEISLVEALQPEHIAVYGQRATGTKYLINPICNLRDWLQAKRWRKLADQRPVKETYVCSGDKTQRPIGRFPGQRQCHATLVDDLAAQVARAAAGGGEAARAKHVARGKLPPRERVQMLLDPGTPFLEVAPLAATPCT